MKRHTLIPMMMVAATLSVLLAATASAKPRTTAKVVISPRAGVGVWIGRDVDRQQALTMARLCVLAPGIVA